MTALPQRLLASLEDVKGFDREAFIRVHEQAAPLTSIRLNPAKKRASDVIATSGLQVQGPVPWARLGLYLKKRPSFTFGPLFHDGCYYVQEASSMFLEQALTQLSDLSKPLKVLDLCAAPGGKSTHLQSLLSSESLLVSNEVIKSRANILTDNMIKWGCSNVIVTNNDPAAFEKLTGFFDIVVVDAPCSGSGLFRKDKDAIQEWSSNNVQLCFQRQQRILANILPALKQDGLLIYSTCSYSKEENEDVAKWLQRDFGMLNEKLTLKSEWHIIETEDPIGYRFFPDKLEGEGLFMSCFRKAESVNEARHKPERPVPASANETQILKDWILDGGLQLCKENKAFFALPEFLINDYGLLRTYLNIQYKGTELGQIMKNKLVPHHALALSKIISGDVPVNEVSAEQAILYLQKKDLMLDAAQSGWQLISFQREPLGWINALSNRINNYYPKELRIRNDSSHSDAP